MSPTARGPRGMGSIRLRADGRWEARYYARGRQRSITGLTQDEVRRRLTRALADRDQGIGPPANMTVNQLLDRWLEGKEFTVKPRTYEAYADKLRLYVRPRLGKLRLSALTPAHIQRMQAELLRVLSPRSVHHVHAVLHNVLRASLSPALSAWRALLRVKTRVTGASP